jgi:myo-inositol-1(or 4)-monophosphatase
MVTEADRASEELITAAIRERYPGHAILGEEGGRTAAEGTARFTWVIDPLDGTTNFVHGLPIYAVSIALSEGEEPVLGVVYLPSLEVLYSAARGGGAFKNGRPLQASRAASLAESLVVTGIPYDRAVSSDNNLDYITAIAPQVQGLRRLGAAALDLCLVAEGSMDAYWELKVKPWDIAAGLCVAREAGAAAKYTAAGEQLHVLAAAPRLYRPLKRALLQTGSHFAAL